MDLNITSILIIIGLLLIIIEFFTISTLLIWIGIGFLFAGFMSLFTNNAVVLIVTGTIVCVASLVIFRDKFKNGLLAGKTKKTSYEELIGKKAIVTAPFVGDDVNRGTVKINGVEWIAMANDQLEYLQGEIVCIEKIDGAKMYIRKEEKWS